MLAEPGLTVLRGNAMGMEVKVVVQFPSGSREGHRLEDVEMQPNRGLAP